MSDLGLSRETAQESPKVVCLAISGEADETNGQRAETYFDELLKSDQPRHVLLDLSGLSFAGSAFFGTLVLWKEQVTKASGRLVLFGLRPEVISTLRIFSLDRHFTIRPDRQAALEALPK